MRASARDAWMDVLEIGEIGGQEEFFETCGGNSLLAGRVIFRMRASLGIDIPLARLFDHPRFDDFVASVCANDGADAPG